jgi:predicted RNase H-like HicB family nuclease
MNAPKYSADVRWSEEDRAYVALCPELGDLSALGDSPQEALTELGEAIGLATQTYHAHGWPLPEPAVHQGFSGQFRVRMPRSLHAWLVREAHREGVSLNTLVIARLAEARGQRRERDRGELASEEASPVEIAP